MQWVFGEEMKRKNVEENNMPKKKVEQKPVGPVRDTSQIPKLTKPKKEAPAPKPLSREEVSKYKPTPSLVDHSDNIKQVMGLGLGATYDLAVANKNEVTVANVTHKHNKLGDIDRLPKPVK